MIVPIELSVSEWIASPIWPSRPPTSPAPNSMRTAMPLAIVDRYTDPASEMAVTITAAAASSIAGSTTSSGHQPPASPVITVDAP